MRNYHGRIGPWLLEYTIRHLIKAAQNLSQNKKCFSLRIAVVFAQSTEAKFIATWNWLILEVRGYVWFNPCYMLRDIRVSAKYYSSFIGDFYTEKDSIPRMHVPILWAWIMRHSMARSTLPDNSWKGSYFSRTFSMKATLPLQTHRSSLYVQKIDWLKYLLTNLLCTKDLNSLFSQPPFIISKP